MQILMWAKQILRHTGYVCSLLNAHVILLVYTDILTVTLTPLCSGICFSYPSPFIQFSLQKDVMP